MSPEHFYTGLEKEITDAFYEKWGTELDDVNYLDGIIFTIEYLRNNMNITPEILLNHKKFNDLIEERCSAFLGAEYHLTSFEIDDTHITIYGEDDHREPFTEYIRMHIEEFCNTEYYNLMLKKRNDKLNEIKIKNENKLKLLLDQKEFQEKQEYERLKEKYG